MKYKNLVMGSLCCILSLFAVCAPPHSYTAATPPHSFTGTAPHCSAGTAPHSSTGAAPHSSTGAAPHCSAGAPPHSPAGTAPGSGFTVTGYIRGLKAPYVYLEWAIGDSVHKDSTAVKDGRFRITGKIDQPTLVYLATKEKAAQFFLENSSIHVNGHIDSLDDLRVTGSTSQRTYDSLRASLKDVNEQLDKLYDQYSTAHKNKDSAQQAILESSIDSLGILKKGQIAAFIRTHPHSPVSLGEIVGMSYTGDYSRLNGLYSALDQSLQGTPLGKAMARRLDIMSRTSVGQKVMDFTQNDMEGRTVQFSGFNKGHYILLDFWASWCGPCRAENPNVLKAYNRFKSRNFEILGVSLDDNGTKWKEAVTKDGMPWMQVSDLKGWKNIVAQQYGIQAIPSNFLVDPNGVIIARDLRGMALEKKLAEVLGDPAASAGTSTDPTSSNTIAASTTPTDPASSGNTTTKPAGQPSLEELRAAVEAHPDSAALHDLYIKAFRKSIPNVNFSNADSVMGLLKLQYDAWIQRFPNSAAVTFAIGHAFANAESPEAKPYLLKTVALNPKMAEAYADLAIDAERWGEFDASDAYLKKAMEADPTSPDYASSYAFAMERTDPAKYRKLSQEVAKNFPDSDRGAQMLYWLAYRSNDEGEKAAVYRQLKEKFPPTRFNWSASAMLNYFDLLLTKSPDQALALAHEMAAITKEDDEYEKKQWESNIHIAEHIVQASKALDEHRPADALSAMTEVKLSRWSDAKETVNLLKAKAADAAGNTQAAFDTLLVLYAKEPSDETRTMMLKYARKLGKDEVWMDAGVQRERATAAKDAPAFKLYAYKTGDSVSLKDYRGKVVLLTFWFPGCGPCRGEFPHFQAVLNKFKAKDIAYVGINVVLSQDPYVVPFMRSSGYTFTPLRDNDRWAEKAYNVRGAPSNYLIDKDGRIIFSNFMIQNPKAQRMLELMIGSLLPKKA